MTGRGLDSMDRDGRWLRTGRNGGGGRGSGRTRLREHGRRVGAARSRHTLCPIGGVGGKCRPRVGAFRERRGARNHRKPDTDTATTSCVVAREDSPGGRAWLQLKVSRVALGRDHRARRGEARRSFGSGATMVPCILVRAVCTR